MKVLLVNPQQTFYRGSDIPAGNLPLGLMYIAAVLERGGHEASILDAFMEDPLVWKSEEKTMIGMPPRRIREEIGKRNPDVVGVSNPFTSQLENAIAICGLAKEVNPRIVTVVGGPHVSAVPLQFLSQAKSADIAVIGEGEQAMLDLASIIEKNKKLSEVPGIAFRNGNAIIQTQPRSWLKNLDELPYPAYHLVNMEKYLHPRKIEYRSFQNRSISMITSRGCPFNCCFCSVRIHMGRLFRSHSPDYVADHIDHVVRRYRVKTIFFEDDNLTLDIERFEAICDRILEREINVKWETPNGVRADCLNARLLRKMKRSGCQSLFFGIESGDQSVLSKVIGKNLDLGKVVEVAKTCKAIGLKTGAFYIIGFPGEKKENMLRTIEFALRLRFDYDVGMHLFFATPSIGTRLYEECIQKGYIPRDLTSRSFAEARQAQGVPLIETEDFATSELQDIARVAVKRYRRLSLLSYMRNPAKTLETAVNKPSIVGRFVRSLYSD